MDPIDIARIAHEANRAYCKTLGDNSQIPWPSMPQWQIDSALEGVRAIMADPDITPEESHENWLSHKRREGWMFGYKKDPMNKRHPCMVPYNELPADQRMKDHLFIAIVRVCMEDV